MRISLAPVLRQQAIPWTASSACTRGAPYVWWLARWTSRILVVKVDYRRSRALGDRLRAA